MNTQEASKIQHTHLYFVRDNKTSKEIFSIMLESNGNWKTISDDNIIYNEKEVRVDSRFYQKEFAQFMININDDIIDGPISKESLLYYIDKFENISSWLNCVYKPKWQERLGEEFFEAVRKYIEHDLYLFCETIDGTSAYEDIIQGNEKRWIKK